MIGGPADLGADLRWLNLSDNFANARSLYFSRKKGNKVEETGYENLQWFITNLDQRRTCLLTWKALHTAEPPYLSELISPYVPARTLRSSNTFFLQCQLALQVTSPHVFFCFCTVNLELLTGTYSLFGETLYL